jgi:hypothetical protein
MTRTAIAVGALVVMGAVGEAWAALSVSVTPPVLDLSIPLGVKKTYTLQVGNLGDMEIRVTPRVMDLTLDPTGAALPAEPGSSARSCAKWVSLDLGAFSLDPGESREREMVLSIPRGVSGGYYCVVVFEAVPVGRNAPQSQLSIAARTGTIILETVPRSYEREGDIVESRVSKRADGEMEVVAYFANTGNVHVQVRPSCVIKSREGKVVDRVKMEAGTGTVLPEGTRRMAGIWSNKRKMVRGDYTAEIAVEYRGRKRATRSVEFRIE